MCLRMVKTYFYVVMFVHINKHQKATQETSKSFDQKGVVVADADRGENKILSEYFLKVFWFWAGKLR